MKKTPNIIDAYYKSLGTKIFRDTTALPFADGGPLNDRNIHGDLLPSVYASALGRYYSNGGKFLTAGGEYHRIYKNPEGDIMVNHPQEDKGKWDTINLTEKADANTITEGVEATKQWHADNPNVYGSGGQMKPDYSLPEDSFQQGGKGLKNSVYASSMGQYPAPYAMGGAMNQYPDGGPIYTYAKRPGSYYQKDENGQWYISNKGTGGQYVPVEDPSGQRAAALNKGAIVTMANPTVDKYSNVAPSYGKSPMVQSVAGRTEAERQPVQNEIAGQQFAQNMERDYAQATKDQLPQHEQPLDMMDYAWQAAAGAPAALKGLGQVAALKIPFTEMSLGTAANVAGGIHGATQVPDRIQDWQDVSAGDKTWQEALIKSLGTTLEIAPGIKQAIPNMYKVNPFATKLGNYNRVVGEDAIVDLQNSGLVRAGERGGVSTSTGTRTSAYPSFGKGAPKQAYIDQTIQQGKTPYIISTNRPMAVSTLGRHGKGSTMFPVDEAGNYSTAFSADDAQVFNSQPHWLKGYQEVSKKIIPESAAGLEGGRVFNTIYPQVITSPTTGLKQYGSTTLIPNYGPKVPAGLIRSNNTTYSDAALLPVDQQPFKLTAAQMEARNPAELNAFYKMRATERTADKLLKRQSNNNTYYDINGNIIKTPKDNY